MTGADETLERLRTWLEAHAEVRAAMVVGSRADEQRTVDALSDHDVLLFLAPDASLRDRDDWFAELGPVAVAFRDSVERPWGTVPTRLVQYRDGSRIDFTLSSTEELKRITRAESLPPALDRGYLVLLDRDGLCSALPEPTGRSYLTDPPSEEVKAALDAMIDLFRDAAREVGEALGYAYPTATERDVTALLDRIAEAGEAGATQS